ncbi:unnamed protein product [Allacma fusca]|uniref:Uncharacterized protein n=1 Tax=Allacma fusca TaxID=39272 RepID=A0A8J2PX28_9HEXA|nr:unnamed protein product [Allacma fusca]
MAIVTFGPKNCFIIGISINGIFSIFLGLLKIIPSNDWFIVGAFTCLSMASLGGTITYITVLTYAAKIFPDHFNLIIGASELFSGIAEFTALSIGGVLHGVGGFALPFISFGVLHLISIAFLIFLLPSDKKNRGGAPMYLLGPLPIFGLDNTVWLNIFSLMVITLGTCLANIPATEACLLATIEAGHPDETATCAMVCSLMSTGYSLGTVIGTFAAGFLVEGVGYPLTSALFGSIMIAYGLHIWHSTVELQYLQWHRYDRKTENRLLKINVSIDPDTIPILPRVAKPLLTLVISSKGMVRCSIGRNHPEIKGHGRGKTFKRLPGYLSMIRKSLHVDLLLRLGLLKPRYNDL